MKKHAGFHRPSSAVGILCAAAALLLLHAPALQAQHASITGRVTSNQSGEPIGGAEVTIRDAGRAAVTSKNGLFRIENLSAGEHHLTIEYLGAKSEDFRVVLGVREALDVAFNLEMKVIPVPELEVTVNDQIPIGKLYSFYRRAENHPGYFITRQDIENRNTSRATDLLRQVPGLDIGPRGLQRTSVTMGRRHDNCVPEYYLDGARAPFFDLDNLQTVDIAGIEVYRGNSETPPAFKHKSRCGAIIIWTRDPSNWKSFQ